MGELDGRVALVTGGGSGIGEASARALAAAGATVAVADLQREKAESVAKSIEAAGGTAIGVAFDTSIEKDVAAGISTVSETFGGLDILHNNAAITSVEFMMRDGMVHQLDVDLWDQTMAVNLRGYMLCAKHAIPLMLSKGRGAIVNTSSGAGLQGELVRSAYGASKAAIMAFTRSVATQYGKMGIRCNTVMPGMTLTATVASGMPPAILDMMRRHTLLTELAKPEDVANAVVFLASDRSAAVTGAVIPVDGGFGIHGPSFADEVAMWAASSGAASAATADRFRAALESRARTELTAADAAQLEELLGADLPDREGVIRAWGALAAADAQASITVDTVYADDLHVIGTLDIGNDRIRVRQANMFHLDKQGKAVGRWALPADSAVAQALAGGQAPPQHPNVARFQAAEEARARNVFEGEDLDLINEFLREDVHWISPWGKGPENRDEVVAQFRQFKAATGGTFRLDLHEVFADDVHAVSLVRLTADRPDKPDRHMDVLEANVFHLDGNGQCFEFFGVALDPSNINNFWM